MLVDMRCPKCGGNSTQYDERKWRCLHCSNYFLYEPIEPPKTTVQHFVNISGDAQYDLDVSGATAARPQYDTLKDGWPTAVYSYNSEVESIAKYEKEATGRFGFFTICVVVMFFLIMVTVMFANANSAWGYLTALAAFYGLSPLFGSLTDYFEARSCVKSAKQRKEALENPESRNLVAYQPLCPYCRAEVSAINKVLTHCLKCGKRFYYAEPTSFPIKVQ